MKNSIYTFLALFASFALYAQSSENIVVREEGGYAVYALSSDVACAFPDFRDGEVIFEVGSEVKAKLNYNFIRQRMMFLQNEQSLEITDVSRILYVKIDSVVFVPTSPNGTFSVVLVDDAVSLLKQITLKDEAVVRNSYGMVQATAATDKRAIREMNYKQAYTFYLWKDGKTCAATKSKFKKLFPSLTVEIDKFVQDNAVKFDSEKDLTTLLLFCNEKIKNQNKVN